MRRLVYGLLALAVLGGGMAHSAHMAYRPLQVGLQGEDIYELQMTLGYFDQSLGAADGILDERTFAAMLEFLGLEANTQEVGGEHLLHLYWFYLARHWPEDSFIVPEGCSWAYIAGAFGVPVMALRLVNSDTLMAGQSLRVPVEYDIHPVLEGDTLAEVAARYHVCPEQLSYWNQLPSTGELGGYDRLLVVMGEVVTLKEAESEDDSLSTVDYEKIRSSVLALAREGRVSCPALLELAEELDVLPRQLGKCADELGLKISGCQLGCFR